MSYPAWTYDELAFPQLNVASDFIGQNTGGSISVDTPALRGGVACAVVPKNRLIELTVQDDYLTSNISTADGCGNSGLNDQPLHWLTYDIKVPANSGYFGASLPRGFGPATCPAVTLYYGHISNNTLDYFAAISCTQYLERVQSTLIIDLPSLSISSPPTVHSGSSVNFSSWYPQLPDFQVLGLGSTKDEQLDNTFNAMVYGRDGVAAAELLNNTQLIKSYTHLYRLYMAQVANIYLRAKLSAIPNDSS